MTQPPSSAPATSANVKQAIADARSLVQRGKAVVSAAEHLRESIRHQLDIATAEEVESQLRGRDLDELRPLAGGTRFGALSKAGFRTIADVRQAGRYRLAQVPGVGPATAERVESAAQTYAEKLRAATRVRLDAERRPPTQTQLLALISALDRATAAAATLTDPVADLDDAVAPLAARAQPAASRFRMLFAGNDKKGAARSAAVQLQTLLADRRTEALRSSIDSAERGIDPASYAVDQLWREYQANAAAVNSLLDSISGAEAADAEAAHGYIADELRQEISAVPLDTGLLTATLRKYQVFGAQYALHQERTILGDEMGLGKTVQALAVFAHMTARGHRHFLVICPASVQINWLNEIEKHTRLTAHNLYGRDREANGQRWLRDGGVAVTTYGTLGRLTFLTDAEIAMLAVDEAHYVKNPATQRARQVRLAGERSQRLLFLTGTPMENRVEEFRNLVGYLRPEVAARIDASDAVAGARHFRKAVAPVYLRRNQEDVLTELPEKIEVEDWVQLSSADLDEYRDAVAAGNMMRMRRAAYAASSSAKLERLVEIVEEAFEDGRKVIVFSFFLDVLGTVGTSLGAAAIGPLTGRVSPPERQRLIEEFTARREPAALLSQIEAGGVGLNVQAASVVIIAEPQWKPATEDQAIARAHRMGQTRPVQVHRLLAKDSVDERMREILEHKQLLFAEFARKSDAKQADPNAVDGSFHRPEIIDDEAVPAEQRVLIAERHRLGLDSSDR
ncbi:SNF2-related protein [Nocardia sp. NPDC050712]|uniref:DEAD/DEAH box helicase n=1 Tax=Nocardia sp. NPDC050712 TaxID=3155518 RepID=UPI0033FDF64A